MSVICPVLVTYLPLESVKVKPTLPSFILWLFLSTFSIFKFPVKDTFIVVVAASPALPFSSVLTIIIFWVASSSHSQNSILPSIVFPLGLLVFSLILKFDIPWK